MKFCLQAFRSIKSKGNIRLQKIIWLIKMDSKAAIIVSCWFTIAIISSVYMIIFGREVDIMFGVLMPIGFLILLAVLVTFLVLSEFEHEKK